MLKATPLPLRPLTDSECVFYRDQFRKARYAALADAEGFSEVCFALEELGLRLFGNQADLGSYRHRVSMCARASPVLSSLASTHPSRFKTFDALYDIVRKARNDAMHTGSYARNATEAAISLSIGLEEALMAKVKKTAGSLMVNSPVGVEPWHLVAQARQLMLTHSFSFLPIRLGVHWYLVSELGLAKFLNVETSRKFLRLAMSLTDAVKDGLILVTLPKARLLTAKTPINDLLDKIDVSDGPMLWLVLDDLRDGHLAGIRSPFELM